jgi:hypothetical protein
MDKRSCDSIIGYRRCVLFLDKRYRPHRCIGDLPSADSDDAAAANAWVARELADEHNTITRRFTVSRFMMAGPASASASRCSAICITDAMP